MHRWVSVLTALVLLAGCPTSPPPADANRSTNGVRRAISDDVLARPPETSHAVVKFVLLSWDEVVHSHPHVPSDPRSKGRTKGQAETLALEILDRARHGDDFNALMAQYSEDPGSAKSGIALDVRPSGALEPNFQALALRLHVGEVGICQTAYGLHVVKRLE